MNSLGNNSKTTFLIVEYNKLSLEFEAAVALKVGQPVKLAADGKVTLWAAADLRHTFIGICYSDAAIGDLVTVFTRGYAEMYALSNAACPAGAASYAAYDAATAAPAGGENTGLLGWSKYGPAAAPDQAIAWNLVNAVGANELIRVLIMG